MTKMQAQDTRARRRRARWGPEAGVEPHDSAAAQPLQATPTPPAIAGKAYYAEGMTAPAELRNSI